MIAEIINFINSELAALQIFTKFEGLTDKISRTDGDKKITFPALFEGNEFTAINFDFTDGLAYHQLNGSASFAEIDSVSGCGIEFEYVIPLKLVGFLNVSVLQNDKYLLFNLCESIAVNLMSNSTALKQSVKSRKVEIMSSSFDSNSESVFNDQFSGIDYKIDNNHAFISVDYEVKLTTSKNCFDINCFLT